MPDVHTKKQRSFNMSRIKNKDTRPEIEIRKLLFKKGFRYRLHKKDLPGKPDIVFPRHKATVFINGCFWHYHDCHLFKMPETRKGWWNSKLSKNQERDKKNIKELLEKGWRVLVIWECSFRSTKNKVDCVLIEKIVDSIIGWINGKSIFFEIGYSK